MLRRLLLSLLLCLAAPAAAQPAQRRATVRVTLHTSLGDIVLELERRARPSPPPISCAMSTRAASTAPNSTARCRLRSDWGLIQGGMRDPRLLYPPIAHEPTTQTGLSPCRGRALDAAPRAGQRAGRFLRSWSAPQPYLDADPGGGGDGLGYRRCSAASSRAWTWSAASSRRRPRRPRGRA